MTTETTIATTTYTPADPIWCAGCGHYGVQGSLVRGLDRMGVAPHEVMLLAGIGCSGTVQNNLGTYGYHALHGRVLPTATGFHYANPAMTVVAAGGDGDGYAIGMGHLVHTFRRNPSLTYVVMNNGTYGLTKGQPSPTGDETVTNVDPIDAVTLGLSITNTGFIARGFTRRVEQMDRLVHAALEHARSGKGFAFVEILSPCVTYNDTYAPWESLLVDVDADESYDPTDRRLAMATSLQATMDGRMVVGMIYHGESSQGVDAAEPGSIDVESNLEAYDRLLGRFQL